MQRVHTDPTKWAAALMEAPARWELLAVRAVNAVTFEVYGHVVSDPLHPVDTGRSRSAWAISVYAQGTDVPPEGGSGYEPKPVAAFQSELANAPFEAARFVYNNVNYTIWLEIGARGRPGVHMLRRAVQSVAITNAVG